MWTIFSSKSMGYTSCGEISFDLIIIKREVEEAFEILKKECFKGLIDNQIVTNLYYCKYGKNLEEIWKECTAFVDFGCRDIEVVFSLPNVVVFKDYRTVMPNGTDGMICNGYCKEFHPYVEPNQPYYTYICVDCRNNETEPEPMENFAEFYD